MLPGLFSDLSFGFSESRRSDSRLETTRHSPPVIAAGIIAAGMSPGFERSQRQG